MTFNQIQGESYEEQTTRLKSIYDRATSRLVNLLARIEINNFTANHKREIEREINKIIRETNKEASKWVDTSIDFAYIFGSALVLFSVGLENRLEKAKREIDLNQQLARSNLRQLKDSTYSDLELMTENTNKRIKEILSRIYMEHLRGQPSQDLREELIQSSNLSITDRAGKVWGIDAYSQTIGHTKLMQAQIDGTVNESIAKGIHYGIISINNSRHLACRRWEGKIVKLNPDAPGSYPLLSELRSYLNNDIFHPRCKHFIIPFLDFNDLPRSIQDLN